MRLWMVLLAAVALLTGALGCQNASKWHECTDCELRAARSAGEGVSSPTLALRANDQN